MDGFPAPAPFGASPAPPPPPELRSPRRSGKRIAFGVCGGLVVLIGAGLAFVFLHTSEIQWTKAYDAGMTRARMETRPVLIDFSRHG